MIDLQWWLPVVVFAVTSTLTPGPNNIMLLASGLNFGARRTLPHGLGIIVGFPVMVFAVGAGLGQMFTTYPSLHQIIKVLGISYLLYLAWKIATTNAQTSGQSSSRPLTFFQAALFQWVNPKAWVMAIGAISAFTTIGAKVMLEVVIIALSFFSAAIISTNTWIFCGVFLKRFLASSRRRRLFNGLMGLLLVASILPMVKTAV